MSVRLTQHFVRKDGKDGQYNLRTPKKKKLKKNPHFEGINLKIMSVMLPPTMRTQKLIITKPVIILA